MIPLSIILSKDKEEQYNDLTSMYEELANAINGHQGKWNPTVEGGTIHGVGTYTTQKGHFYRRGL